MLLKKKSYKEFKTETLTYLPTLNKQLLIIKSPEVLWTLIELYLLLLRMLSFNILLWL